VSFSPSMGGRTIRRAGGAALEGMVDANTIELNRRDEHHDVMIIVEL